MKEGLEFDKSQLKKVADSIRKRMETIERHMLFKTVNLILPDILNDIATEGEYTDRTGALRGSRGAAVYLNGKEVARTTMGGIGSPRAGAALDKMAANTPTEGIVLNVVVGMHYGRYVEAKGYNVLRLSAERLKRKWSEAAREALKTYKEE